MGFEKRKFLQVTFQGKKIRLHWLQILIHVGAWIPLVVLAFDFFNNRLTANPIQAATQRTGDVALILLISSLACTPINILFRYPSIIKIRRALGLYAFLYAAIHLYIFIGLDYAFAFDLLLKDVGNKRYILAGLVSFTLLMTLTITSFRWWKIRLRKNWKRLHKMVYLVNLLVVLHFAWAMKGDILRLQGNIFLPLLAGFIVILLLVIRIPGIRKRISGFLHFQPIQFHDGSLKRQAIIEINQKDNKTV